MREGVSVRAGLTERSMGELEYIGGGGGLEYLGKVLEYQDIV